MSRMGSTDARSNERRAVGRRPVLSPGSSKEPVELLISSKESVELSISSKEPVTSATACTATSASPSKEPVVSAADCATKTASSVSKESIVPAAACGATSAACSALPSVTRGNRSAGASVVGEQTGLSGQCKGEGEGRATSAAC